MGGRGSGDWYRWDKKSYVEDYKRLDIRQLRKKKALHPGYVFSWEWSIDGKPCGDIRVAVKQEHLLLTYRTRQGGEDWKDVEEKVHLTRTNCNYGGTRQWFICPGCGRRIAVLVSAGTYFLCRRCYDLSYSSQNETELDRMHRKARKIRASLGEKEWLKPKGMHQKTFDRIRRQLYQAERVADIALMEIVTKKFGLSYPEI